MVWVGQPPDIEPSTHTHSCALQLPLRAKRETERAMGVGRWGIAGVGRHTREKRAAREWSTMPNRDRERERERRRNSRALSAMAGEREHNIGTMQTDSRNTLKTIQRYNISVFQVFIEDE